MVPTWHSIGAPGFCAVFASNTVFWMTRSGEPKMAAPNMLGASQTFFANFYRPIGIETVTRAPRPISLSMTTSPPC